MSEPDPKTVVPTNDPKETVDDPTATPTPDLGTPAPTDDDANDMVTISKKDLKALQSSRDKNFETSRQTQAAVEALMKKDYVKDFLSDPENAKKFPDVEIEDLLGAEDEDDVIKLAEAEQQRVERKVQKHLSEVEIAEPPTISSKDKATKLKALDTPQPNAFQKFMAIGTMRVKD